MKKKEYMQPAMEVVDINMNAQILAGSVTSVATTGLDDDNLVLPSGGDPISGVLNSDAW